MKRLYTIEDFELLIEKVTKVVGPDLHLCTDIICGFPTERDEDWQKTMEICKKYTFRTLYISPYFSRPGTPAAKLPYIYGDNDPVEIRKIKKARTRELYSYFEGSRPYENRIGKKAFWFCFKPVMNDKIHFPGWNKFGEIVCIPKPEGVATLEGKILEVIVEEANFKYQILQKFRRSI